MIHREHIQPPAYVYPLDEWRMLEKRFYPRFLAQTESIFATANGYLGLRGTFEEGEPASQGGTFVNGFYESWPIVYGEEAYGFAKTGQTIVNVTDAKIIKLYVDDEPFFLPTANLTLFERALDMKNGTLDRELLWETPSGKRVSIKSRRLVSFAQRHLAAISYEVTVLNAAASVVLSSELVYDHNPPSNAGDPRRAAGLAERALVPKVNYIRDRRIVLGHTTAHSKMSLACAIDHELEADCRYSTDVHSSDDSGKVVFCIDAKPGVPVRLSKYITYHTSRHAAPQELCERAERTLDRAVSAGFEKLASDQREYMDDFWRRSDVEIEGDPAIQQAIRFNLFHILQAVGRAEGSGVPAKGLTGRGYEGQYFWDTEIYVLPFLVYTAPRIARNLLKFRYSFLDKARERAGEVNQKGALFPWRTINGEEASANYAAGTAQCHINADIAYALQKYVNATGDDEFLHGPGVEMLVETARFWIDLGFFSERTGGQFCIHGVTGPDEYNTVVNNNMYTNMMARENLRYAVSSIRALEAEHPARFAALAHELKLDHGEIDEWKQAADNMHIPYDEGMGIHLQDDTLLDKETWDFANTPADKYPLLLHYHPLVIYRHRVIKQADVVLATFLLSHEFSPQQKKANFDYYDPLTTGDSSLSVGIQSILAFEIGYLEKAEQYARYALLMDVSDVGGNVRDGCHIASMGGAWMAIVYGYAGMRDNGGSLSFDPRVPEKINRLRFRLTLRGQLIEVDIQRESVTYSLLEGDGLEIRHQDREVKLAPGSPVSIRSERLL